MGEFLLSLTAEEAALLDGRVSAAAQSVVERAKEVLALSSSGLSEKEAAMVAEIVATARSRGRLTFAPRRIEACPCCGRRDGYYPHQRSGKYHRKGEPNYKTPKTFAGYDLDQGFIVMQGHIGVGFCETCRERVEAVLLPLLAGVEAEYPERWHGAPQRFRRFDHKRCTACGWEGHEGEMRQFRTLMGDGAYPGGCPKCPAENLPLGRRVIEPRDGFSLVEKPAIAKAEGQ